MDKSEKSFLNGFGLATILVIVIWLSRLAYSYSDPSGYIIAPDQLFGRRPGQDILIGAAIPAFQIILKEQLYNNVHNYGPALSLTFVPLLRFLNNFGFCSLADLVPCSLIIHKYLVFLTIIGYFIFIWIVTKREKETRYSLILFTLASFLGTWGTHGLERANIDIFYSLLIGIVILIGFKTRRHLVGLYDWFLTIISGFISGFLVNSKIFLFMPMTFVGVIFRQKVLFYVITILTFLVFSYIPELYGIQSNPVLMVQNALSYLDAIPFLQPGYLEFNHSMSAIATIWAGCLGRTSCDYQIVLVTLLSYLIFLVVFILPIIMIIIKRFKKSGLQIADIGFCLVLYADAGMNLLPKITMSYRLYYSLPLLILLWVMTRTNTKARLYCILSMVTMVLYGLWPISLGQFVLTSPALVRIFVVLHFYFLLSAGLANAFL